MERLNIFTIGLALSLCWTIVNSDDLKVCLKDMGCMKGTYLPGYDRAKEFEAFMGIPFAQPPVGDLRLKNPLPPLPWKGTLDASVAKNICIQRNYFLYNWDVNGVEDCLYLNLYRPKSNKRGSKLLPVMVYIHSGGFISGAGYPTVSGPEYMMETEEIIFIVINYRLGPFGFISTGDKHMPGNFGFKDQRMALQWVQKHISSFGGDANLVTIFGHSAGGISSHYHILSENSKGLFHRASSLSGTAFSIFMNTPLDHLEQTRKLAEVLKIPNARSLSTEKLAEAMRQVNATALVYSTDSLKIWDNVPIMNYAPSVEEPSPEAFFTESPIKSHLEGRIHQVPWLLGTASRSGEGAIFLLRIMDSPHLLAKFNEKFLENLAILLSLTDKSPKVIEQILDLYGVKDKELNNNTLKKMLEMLGDFCFQYPLYQSAISYASHANLKDNPMSIYSFEYHGRKDFSSYFTQGKSYDVGAVHMDDCLHTLRVPVLIPDYPKDSIDTTITRRMTSLLIEFAKTGFFGKETSLKPCEPNSFNIDKGKICNYRRFGGENDSYIENIVDHVDVTAFSMWKKLYL